uniref:OmpR/PhoB-type domain-containing protein n=1 Tax=Heterorhabditis bacteriophora TaxID=37862 RepID=A0A1I7WKC8_HETBA
MECTTLRTALCRLINSFVIQSTSYSQFEISLEHLEYLRYSLHKHGYYFINPIN